MGTKTITIMDDAYELLKKAKGSGESFSDVIRRDYSKKKNIMDLAGSWSDEFAESVKKSIKENRAQGSKRDVWRGSY